MSMRYSFVENLYIEKNYPYIPVPIECRWDEYEKANRLCIDGIIGISDMSDKKDYVKGYCLNKDLDKVSKILHLQFDVTGGSGNEYLNWMHDGLFDEFGDAEVDKRSRFGFINDMREKNRHRVIHYILDNIDKYCGYFIKCDCDNEWLYALYDDARVRYFDDRYSLNK